ncbi:hypothetical protein EMCRGX_G006263 [Ephydatia muelleri]
MVRDVLRVALILVWTCPGVLPGYLPLYLPGSQVLYNGTGSLRHPDGYHGASNYFRSAAIISDVPGVVVVGGADHVIILNASTLDVVQRLTFEATSPGLASCSANSTFYDVDYVCRNHLRVFPSSPTDPTRLVVCGSEAIGTPSCRTVNASGLTFGAPVPAPGIVPSSPEYFGYGTFFNVVVTLSNANFFAAVNTPTSAYLAFYTVNYSNPLDLNSLSIRMKFRTPTARNWFADPTTIVDVVNFEYPPRPSDARVGGPLRPDEHKFFYVFMREANDNQLTPNTEVISRMARICQNDPGSPTPDTGTGYPYPTTLMKAQIYCNRTSPAPEYPDLYTYHYLQSVAFNSQQVGGRYSQSQGAPIRLLYGAFTTSPRVGGKTSAICVYSADDSKDYYTDAGGVTGSVIDVFRLDLINSVTRDRTYNILRECDPAGRWVFGPEYADYINAAAPAFIVQYTPDPLVVINGVNVVKMAVDQVCVAYLGVPVCLMQDVLFLGTDDGKLMKVAVSITGTPVVIEELVFDNTDPINQLDIQSASNSVLVTTDTKVYIVPLERCSYKYGANCSACIQSRDPYCVWNDGAQMCERNYLTEPYGNISTSYDSSHTYQYYQNIHTGVVQGLTCTAATPSCSLATISDPTNNQVPEIQVQLVGPECSSVTIRVTGLLNNSGGISSSSIMRPVLTSKALLLNTSIIGYQSYEVTALSPGGVVGRAVLTTNPQAPFSTSVAVHLTPLNSTAFRVNIQVLLLTDDIYNYWFQVHYMSTMSSSMRLTTIGQSYVVVDSSLQSATPIKMAVNVSNSQGSIVLYDTITLPLAPPTCTSSVAIVTATSVTLRVTSTMSTYQGYTVIVNGTKRSDCTQPVATPNDIILLSGLVPFTPYYISVQACNDAGEGPSCGLLVTTLCASPGRVGGHLTPTDHSACTRSPCVAILRLPGQAPIVTLQATPNLTLPSLQPSTTCCVTVAAINTCGGTSYEGLGNTTCGRTLDTPPTVQNLSAVVLSPHSILLTWTKQQQTGVRYTITSSLGTTNVTNVSSVIFEGLSQGVAYSFTVQPSYGALVGSRVTANVTIPFPPTPPVPGTLIMVTNSTRQVSFSWSGGGALVQRYNVYLQCNGIVSVLYVTPPTTNVTADVSSFGADFGFCTVRVDAVNALGPSGNSSITVATVIAVPNMPPSRPVSYVRNSKSSGTAFSWLCGTWGCGLPSNSLANFTTSSILLPPPTDCMVWELTSFSVTLKWSTPVGVASTNLSYHLLLSGPAPQKPVSEVVAALSTDPQTWSYSGLSAETNYVISICTVDPTGTCGPVTLCPALLTPSAPLSPPSNLSALWRVNGYVSVFWKAPPITNGTVKVYEVLRDHTPYATCGNSSDGLLANTTVSEYVFRAPNDSTSVLLCVRGYNGQWKGVWAWLRATPLVAAVATPTSSSLGTPLLQDPGLLVAVVLSFVFMVSTAVLAVVVSCICWRHTASFDLKTSRVIVAD